MADRDHFPEKTQYPLNTVGPKGQHAFVGVEKIFFTGTTGQVGTAYGIPGVTVTRTATGVYRVNYPPAFETDIIPGIQAPTGNAYNATITANNPPSGTAELQITRNMVGTGSTLNGGMTSTITNYNPASGTVASLLFFVAPQNRY